MTSTSENKGRTLKASAREEPMGSLRSGTSQAKPVVRRLPTSSSAGKASVAAMRAPAVKATVKEPHYNAGKMTSQHNQSRTTAIEQCVQHELRRYFDMLDGEEPTNLYRMVVKQVEHALIDMVMQECRGNQTRASEWLGISRGNLRTKLSNMDK